MTTTGIRRHRRYAAAAVLIGVVALGWLAGAPGTVPGGHGPDLVRAATPTASPAVGGDTRSAGEGPGLVGSPVLAVLGVLAIGLTTAGLTLLYLRLTGERVARTTAAAVRPSGPATDEPPSD